MPGVTLSRLPLTLTLLFASLAIILVSINRLLVFSKTFAITEGLLPEDPR
jgi:hypothetical protein